MICNICGRFLPDNQTFPYHEGCYRVAQETIFDKKNDDKTVKETRELIMQTINESLDVPIIIWENENNVAHLGRVVKGGYTYPYYFEIQSKFGEQHSLTFEVYIISGSSGKQLLEKFNIMEILQPPYPYAKQICERYVRMTSPLRIKEKE